VLPKVVVVVETMVQTLLIILEDLVVLVVAQVIKTHQVLLVLVFLVREMRVEQLPEAQILIMVVVVAAPEVPVLMEVLDHTVE
jgi:hypothetical protein